MNIWTIWDSRLVMGQFIKHIHMQPGFVTAIFISGCINTIESVVAESEVIAIRTVRRADRRWICSILYS